MKNYDLNSTIKRFNDLMDYLKANGGEVESSDLSEFEEVSFKILDDIYIMHRSFEENDRYYCLIIDLPMHSRIDQELHTFNDFDDNFNHANIIESRSYVFNSEANRSRCLDYSEFNQKIDSFEKDVNHFIELRKNGYA